MPVLIYAGSDVTDEAGDDLRMSTAPGHVEVVRMMLDNGADSYAVDNEGFI